MSSIYNHYVENKILNRCEEYYAKFLADAEVEDHLTDEDRIPVADHVNFLVSLVERAAKEEKDDNEDAIDTLVDVLICTCVLNKMNEVRLSRLLNEADDELKGR